MRSNDILFRKYFKQPGIPCIKEQRQQTIILDIKATNGFINILLRKQCMSKLVEKNILFPSMPKQNKIVVLKSINKKGSVESSFKKCMQCRSRRQSWKRTTLCLRLL